MTRYIYDEDEAGKFVRLPRSILLAPYLLTNPYYIDFTDGIDTVMDYTETQQEGLSNLRDVWVLGKDAEGKNYIDSSFDGGAAFDTLVQQVNLLGFRLTSPMSLNDQTFRIMSKWLGRYWFEKGTEAFINFASFCLNIPLDVDVLWTRDYVNFISERELAKRLRPITKPDKVYFSDFDPLINTEFVQAGGTEEELLSWSLPAINSQTLIHSTVGGRTGGVGQPLSVMANITSGGSTIVGGAGPYFPTTHIRVRTDVSSMVKFGVEALTHMFYEVDNFNLVIESVDSETDYKAEVDVHAAYGYSLEFDFNSGDIPNPVYNRVLVIAPENVEHSAVGYSEWYDFDTGV